MHKVLVEEKRWLSESEYLCALNFCMLLPGPEAMQLATYAGWKLRGVRGGLLAGLLFVLPGSAVILTLAALYAHFGALPLVGAAFLGIKAAVLAILAQALIRIARRALKTPLHWLIAGLALLAIGLAHLPFALIIAAAALTGYLTQKAEATPSPMAHVPPGHLLKTVPLWLFIWLAPVAWLTLALGSGHVLSQLAFFFSKLAVITFGGAYAVLSVMAGEAVRQGWLSPAQMMDGLGLAETTPGPLILVTLFVGYLAAGMWGALITLWVTFAPCFLWIFAGAPYVETLSARPRLTGALAGVTAAVVGVILHLGLWFAAHTLWPAGPDARAMALALLAFALTFWLRAGMTLMLACLAAAGLALAFIPG